MPWNTAKLREDPLVLMALLARLVQFLLLLERDIQAFKLRLSLAASNANGLLYRKVALHEAFENVPSKFINEKFKEHSHYYGTFFAVLEAERSLRTAINPPYAPLRARRVTSGRTSAALMVEMRENGYEFEELKREIDSAQQRRNREEGTLHQAMSITK